MATLTLLAAGIAFFAAGIAQQRLEIVDRSLFATLMLAIGAWSFLSSLHTAATDVATKVTLAQLQYVAIVSVPPLWLLVTRRAAGHPLPTSRVLVILALMPLLTIGLAWTNAWHGWIWRAITPVGAEVVYQHGGWFWVAASYNYGLLAASIAILARAIYHSPSTFHAQLSSLIVAGCLPWVGNLLYLTRALPIPGLDPTPIAFTLTGLVCFWCLTRQGLLDLAPVARDVLIQHLQDGVIVLDHQRRIVDLNPAALALSGLQPSAVGQPLAAALPALLPAAEAGGAPPLIEPFGPAAASVEVQVDPLPTRGGQVAGWLIVLRNVTAQQALLRRLQELARTDGLTGLRNRAAFDERLAEEIARARRHHHPLSLLLVDIDHFKAYNDTCGHPAGDEALRMVGQLFQEQARQSDLPARYGGEEFAFILPNTNAEEAMLAAERLRRSVERAEWPHRPITISVGVATFNPLLAAEDLVQLADGALYLAKGRGRNQVAFTNRHLLAHRQPPGLPLER